MPNAASALGMRSTDVAAGRPPSIEQERHQHMIAMQRPCDETCGIGS